MGGDLGGIVVVDYFAGDCEKVWMECVRKRLVRGIRMCWSFRYIIDWKSDNRFIVVDRMMIFYEFSGNVS